MIRLIINYEVKADYEQWKNLFRTRCTIQNKMCRVIIHNGSQSSVASSTVVEKLNLSTTKHPQPYTLRWLND